MSALGGEAEEARAASLELLLTDDDPPGALPGLIEGEWVLARGLE